MSLVFSFALSFGCIFLGVTLKGNKLTHKVLVYIHDSGIIIKVSTIIFGTENGYQLLVLAEEAIPIFHYLVTSANQIKVVSLQELLQLFLSEDEPTASLIFFPVASVFIRVVPEEVRHQTAVRHVGWFRDLLDLLETVHIFGDSAVHTHDFLVDKGYQGHVVEAIPERLPKGDLVPSLDLVEKSVDSGNGLRLVVSSQNDNLCWVSHFQSKKQADNLATLLTTVHIVSHE